MADDFRDYMLSFLFWKYLSDNYLRAAKKELGSDYPCVTEEELYSMHLSTPLQLWYRNNLDDAFLFEQQMRRKIHYVIAPEFLWQHIVELARTQNDNVFVCAA